MKGCSDFRLTIIDLYLVGDINSPGVLWKEGLFLNIRRMHHVESVSRTTNYKAPEDVYWLSKRLAEELKEKKERRG